MPAGGGGINMCPRTAGTPALAWRAACTHAPRTPTQGIDMDTFVQALGTFPGVKTTLAKAKAGDAEAQYSLATWMAKGARAGQHWHRSKSRGSLWG